MKVSEIFEYAKVGDYVYVVKPIFIRWSTMRFENTKIVYGTYVVDEPPATTFWNNTDCSLTAVNLPTGTKKFSTSLSVYGPTNLYECFLTPEEAEVWKIIELQNLEQKVEEYIEQLNKKTQNTIKKLKNKEKLEAYLEKYPEAILKVI